MDSDGKNAGMSDSVLPKEEFRSPALLRLAQCVPGTLGVWEEKGDLVLQGVWRQLIIVLLPWKTLALVGLGPEAEKHSQDSGTCYTYDSAYSEEKLSVLWGLCCEENVPPRLISFRSLPNHVHVHCFLNQGQPHLAPTLHDQDCSPAHDAV